MKCELVIFDLDGTLADSLADIGDAMNRVLTECGYPTHSYDSYRFFVGNGIKNLVIQSLPEEVRAKKDVAEKCYCKMIADYGQSYINKTCLYNGIPQLLDNLVQKKMRLAVLSNKADTITQKVCAELLSGWSFSMIIGANDRFPRKPDPLSALFIAESLNISPDKVFYIGDTNVDMQTARAAGFVAVGATWGFRPKAELIDSGAAYTIDAPMELMPLLV